MSTSGFPVSFTLQSPTVVEGQRPVALIHVPADGCSPLTFELVQLLPVPDRVAMRMTISDSTCIPREATVIARQLPLFPVGTYPVELEVCNYGDGPELPVEPCVTVQTAELQVVAQVAHPVPVLDLGACLILVAATLVGALRLQWSK